MFRLLIRVRVQGLLNIALLTVRRNRLLSGLYAVGGTALFLAVFWGFRLFLRLGNSAAIGRDQLVHDLFHFLFLFVLAGAVPFVASTLLQAGDYVLLSSAPVPPTAITAAKLLDATVTNSLQFTVIGIPAVAACGAELSLPAAGWPGLAIILALFLLLPAVATALILLTALAAFGMKRLRRVITAANVVLAAFVCLTMVLEAQRLPIRQAFSVWPIGGDPIISKGAHFGPSGWFSSALLDLAQGRYGAWFERTAWVAALVAALFATCMAIGGKILSSATMAEEGEGERPRDADLEAGLAGRYLSRLMPAPAAAIVAKDVRYTLRDSVLMGQLALPLILYLVPFVLAPHPAVRSMLSWTEIGYVSLVMAGIVIFMQTSIFSLSSVGLEGRSFWIQKCAPNQARMIVAGKFFASFLISGGTGLALTIISAAVFSTPLMLAIVECGIVTIACFALCGMGVGLSALLPRFVYDNPAHRVSVWALILGFVGSVGYIFFAGMLFVIAYLMQMELDVNGWMAFALALVIFTCVSVLAAIVPMTVGARRLEQYQWEH